MNETNAIQFATERAKHTDSPQCLRRDEKGKFYLSSLRSGDGDRSDYFGTMFPDGTAMYM